MAALQGILITADEQSYTVVYDDSTGQVMVELGAGAPAMLSAKDVPLGASLPRSRLALAPRIRAALPGSTPPDGFHYQPRRTKELQ